MKEFLKIEYKRLKRSLSFWIALIIGMTLAIGQYIDEVLSKVQYLNLYQAKKLGDVMLMPHSVFNNWLGGEFATFWHYSYFMILPLLCVIPFGASIYIDRKTGVTKNYFVRSNKINYYFAKYIVGFFSGGIVITIPLVTNLILTSATLPSLKPEAAAGTYSVEGSGMWSELFYTHPYRYCIRYSILIFVFSGLVACLALSLGIFMDNVFSVLIFPFILYLFLYSMLNGNRLNRFVPLEYIDPAQGNGFNSFSVVCFEFGILILISVTSIFIGARRETL